MCDLCVRTKEKEIKCGSETCSKFRRREKENEKGKGKEMVAGGTVQC